MKTKITVEQKYLDPTNPAYNSGAANLAISATIRGAEVKAVGYNTTYEFNAELFPLVIYTQMEPLFLNVENYPIFLQVDPTGEVPDHFEDAFLFDEEGDITGVNTWENWKQSNFSFVDVSGLKFLPSDANNGQHLRPSQCSGVNIVDIATLKKYQADLQLEL